MKYKNHEWLNSFAASLLKYHQGQPLKLPLNSILLSV